MSDTYIKVTQEWFEAVVWKLTNLDIGCPLCGSKKSFLRYQQEGFVDRIGCLDCDKWYNKP